LKVKNGETDFAVLIDATGIPSSITANKIPGIRACTCYNEFSARSAREHNNGNVLVMGAKTLGEETIKSILEVWLDTPFGGGRHQRRLDKITAIEKEFSK
jgi:ribose 5-phosphate isomerase B